MAENLPLIPEKDRVVCADVRPVLREVFRKLDYLPPLALERARVQGPAEDEDCSLPRLVWTENYESQRKEIWRQEDELKQQYAQRIARKPLPNIYKLYPLKKKTPIIPNWRKEQGFLQRKDLIPTIVQNSGHEDSLWVKNILNGSSGDLTATGVRGSRMHLPIRLSSPKEDTVQSLSIGEVVSHPPTLSSLLPPPLLLPEYIICVPPQLDFVNFTVGQLYTHSLRLVNVSKFEIRLSIRPPSRLELDIELSGNRGLTVTSGAAAELKIHFRPRDVRVLHDELLVRVSAGKSFNLPISCYMQPPFLNILVPAISTSVFSCNPGDTPVASPIGSDCLELGARLLGDVHCVEVLYNCDAEHAEFFLLTEDAWLSFCLDALTTSGSLLANPFILWPVWWQGGGSVRGCIWCRADSVGLHSTALRVVCSTAIVRPLNLIADTLYFRPEHMTIEAQEKNYDICSDDDPACEYFVHLGTAFPHRSLSATVQLVNHSPIVYTYYWSVRPWGVCSCWEEQSCEGSVKSEENESLCIGAKEAKQKDGDRNKSSNAARLRVEPSRGSIAPRSSCAMHVCAPDVGERLGTQRAVLMLILKDIPKESFPLDYNPMIIRTDLVESDQIPGLKGSIREVCEVVCAQLEVWWDVAPVRFVLDPPVLPLKYSRRIDSLNLSLRAIQLFGCDSISAEWYVPSHMPVPQPLKLNSTLSCENTLKYPLPVLPNEYPETDVITLEAENEEWRSQCFVTRQCETRHPALRPARAWLGVVPPGARMLASLDIVNDTYQHICWWAEPFRWYRENVPSRACAGRTPCALCQELACSCALIQPSRGALKHGQRMEICHNVNAPQSDGCVATLVRARRTAADVARAAAGAASEARAALLAYRVLAPRLVLRVVQCPGDKKTECEGCILDEGGLRSKRGTATLRPRRALSLSRRTCYRLLFTNLTPIPTKVKWEPALENDVLKVLFIPKEFNIDSYAHVETQVVLEARKVCARRIFVCRARVMHAYNPVYLIIDTAISGLEIECEVPLGGDEMTDSILVMRRSQKEEYPWEAGKPKPSTPEEIFAEEDRKRAVRAENVCHCHYELVYFPPVKRPRPPPKGPDDYPPIEIVWEPPPLTRVCPCFASVKPILPKHKEPYCLQFRQLSVRADQWATDVHHCGVVLQCTPSSGTIGARGVADVLVQVYADCWGLYRDQLLVQVENLEPIVLDIWMEVVGPPLQFALNLAAANKSPALLWMSASDPNRTLRVKNSSRTALTVHAYVLAEHEHPQDVLPFRLYIRFFDVPPRSCPCVTAFDEESCAGEHSIQSKTSSFVEEMDTGVELLFTEDYGVQDDSFFKVMPESTNITPGAWVEWHVALLVPSHSEVAPPSSLLLKSLPVNNKGEGFYRPDPPPQLVKLRQIVRDGHLKLSCEEIEVKLCALDLPYGDVLRIHKHFRVQNVGNGPLNICACTKDPWSVILEEARREPCGAGCSCATKAYEKREMHVPLYLMPRSSREMCVEARVNTNEAWPPPAAPPCQTTSYEPWRRTTTKLRFYDTDNILQTLPLILELEYPKINLEPESIDFGFVTDGDTRKTYFSVYTSSRTVSLDLVTEWVGGKEFQLWPKTLTLAPYSRERIYIQYTARWCDAPVEGTVVVSAACGGGAWCRGAARARATPARDLARRDVTHDFTDDTHLLPPGLNYY